MEQITEASFTRMNNDSNGNPRYVLHFLDCEPEQWRNDYSAPASEHRSLTDRYAATIKLMNKIGGRKFHNKQYGGGIVFQSYSLPETIQSIQRVKKEATK